MLAGGKQANHSCIPESAGELAAMRNRGTIASIPLFADALLAFLAGHHTPQPIRFEDGLVLKNAVSGEVR